MRRLSHKQLKKCQIANRKYVGRYTLLAAVTVGIIYSVVIQFVDTTSRTQGSTISHDSQITKRSINSYSRRRRALSTDCTSYASDATKNTTCLSFEQKYTVQYPVGHAEVTTCRTTLKSLYGAEYQLGSIYWCDNTEFPTDLFNVKERQQGWVALYMVGIVYMFVYLAIVCDDYFVPNLEFIIDNLDIAEDVAGATFMAAGGSAPELFTSIMGVFVAKSNVGIGTIVGSAVFNILFVIGVCAFVVGFFPNPKTGKKTGIQLTWYPLTRDCLFYIISIVLLIVFFNDEKIQWWESLIMFSFYLCYVIFMKWNEPVRYYATKYVDRLVRTIRSTCSKEDGSVTIPMDVSEGEARSAMSEDEEDGDREGCSLAWEFPEFDLKPSKLIGFVYFWITFPLLVFCKYTIPDIRYTGVKQLCNGRIILVSFIMCLAHITLGSFCTVWWATRFGETWNIDSAIMGLTILAAGTSIPDLLTSVIVAKNGYGDMAISSSVGSNIFDVAVGLPLPWLFGSLILYGGGPVNVISKGLNCSIMLLLLMLVVLVISIMLTGWKLSNTFGLMLMILYVVFVVLSLLLQKQTIVCPL